MGRNLKGIGRRLGYKSEGCAKEEKGLGKDSNKYRKRIGKMIGMELEWNWELEKDWKGRIGT